MTQAIKKVELNEVTNDSVNGNQVSPSLIEVPIEEAFGIEVNDSEGNPLTIFGYDEPHPLYTPDIDENYVFRKDMLMKMLACVSYGKPIVLVGPSDCGKTSFLTQFAARLNWQTLLQSSSDETEVADLVGMRYVDEDGTTPFQYGSMMKAAKDGNQFIWDEIDKMRPGVIAKFNAFMEGHPFIIDSNGGEVVRQQDTFFLMATANTKFFGDTMGVYGAAMAQDQASMRRFAIIDVGYMSKEDEDKVLVNYVDNDEERGVMLDFVELVRGSNIPVPFGTGMLCDWAKFADALNSYDEALKLIYFDRLEVDDHKETVKSHYSTAFGRTLEV